MNKEITFEEKVKSMTAKEIIMSMVEGLQNPVVKIKMSTFGDFINGVCYGCAATNAICKISGKVFENDYIENYDTRADVINSNASFLGKFENAIDDLRTGNINYYNEYAKHLGFAIIKRNIKKKRFRKVLPYLSNDYTQQDLLKYIELANFQDNQ